MATTSVSEIERLLKPGSTFRNLNPFFVLQLDPMKLDLEDVKKKYRRLSILVHPDKNPGDCERAQAAFDAVKKAHQMLTDNESRQRCLEVVEEASGTIRREMEEQRKANKKKGLPTTLPEDDEKKFLERVQARTLKLFADLERKRREREDKISEQAAKKREAEIETETRVKMEKEFNKNFEESRQTRVNSWLSFQKGASHKPEESVDKTEVGRPSGSSEEINVGKEKKKKKAAKKFSPMGFRPPKHKPESR